MSDTFWTTQGLSPAVPVLEVNTIGDQQTDIIQNIPGAAGGATPSGWLASAQLVYPRNAAAGLPTGPLSAAELASFATLHSERQRQHIEAQTNGPPKFYRTPATGEPAGYFVLVGNGSRPLNLMTLTLTDWAMLPAADKAAIRPALLATNILTGGATLANRLGLETNKTPTLSSITGLINLINGTNALSLSQADKNVFIDQLRILERQVNAADLIIPDKVALEIKAISDRFDRVKTFASTSPPMTMSSIRFLRNEQAPQNRFQGFMGGVQAQGRAVSSDNNATISSGLQEFMRAERTILAMQKRREGLSAENALRDPKLDVANLIYQLQLLYEGEAGGVADGGTEEIRQLHKLLQDYGIMQRLIQETIKHYDSSKPEEKRRFMNLGGQDAGGVITDQKSNIIPFQDLKIEFNLIDPTTGSTSTIVSPGGRGNNSNKEPGETYEESTGYHWFHLQAQTTTGTFFRVAGTGNPEGVNNFPIWQTLSRQYERHDGGLRVRSNPDDYGRQNGGLSAEEMRVFGMFSDDSWAAAFRQGHPMENLYGIGRPTQQFTGENESDDGSLALLRKTVWDSFSTQLNDTVTLLNQRNQLKQNEIESATRQQNRHFDLGNNALKKMNDLLMTIGRM